MINKDDDAFSVLAFDYKQFHIDIGPCQILPPKPKTYLVNSVVDGSESLPLVVVLSFTEDNTEGFKNVDDIINSSSLNSQLLCNIVKGDNTVAYATEHDQELLGKLTQTLLLSAVAVENLALGISHRGSASLR